MPLSSRITTHIGLIGSGTTTQTPARAAPASPNVQIAAIYGTNPQTVTRLATEYRAMPYNDFAAFLAHKPLDLVILGTPSGLHAQQAIAAAHHALPLLTQHPIAITPQNATTLITPPHQP